MLCSDKQVHHVCGEEGKVLCNREGNYLHSFSRTCLLILSSSSDSSPESLSVTSPSSISGEH